MVDAAAVDCTEKLEWLKTHVDPWLTVEQFWKETSLYRIQQLMGDKTLTSVNYLLSVPALRHIHHGLKLVN